MSHLDVAIRLEVSEGATPARLEAAARDLRQQIRALPGVDLAPRQVGPPGSKGVGPVELAVVALSVVAEAPTLYELLRSLAGWMRRAPRYRLAVWMDGRWLELEGASEADKERILDAWLRDSQRPERG